MSPARDDADAVRSAVMQVAHHTDAKRWRDLRALFAAEVATDYTSLFGGAPQRQPGDALVAGWQTMLGKVATQHLLGPIDVTVTGATAAASCHVRAMHVAPGAPGGAEWEVLGHYRFELARDGADWTITRLVLETLVQRGNAKLLAEAAAMTR